MNKITEILIGAVAVIVTGFITAMVAENNTLKKYKADNEERKLLTKEKIAMQKSFDRLDSLFLLEREYNKRYVEAVTRKFDSLMNIQSANSSLTSKAIQETLVSTEELKMSSMERDSIYNTLK